MVGRMGRLLAVGKWSRILKRDLPSGPRVLRRLAPAVALTSAAPITPSHEYYCSNNGKRLRNLLKLENNDLFAVAYSDVIILYRGLQTPC